jgi:hypothetical protein
MLKAEQSCSNCYYVGRPRQLGASYVCQRNPPHLQWMLLPQQQNPLDPKSVVMQPTACGGWPNTEPELWCGEWRPVESQ